MDFEEILFNTSDYENINKKIGEGIFGKTYLVEKIEDRQQYAAKIIDIQNVFTGKDQMLLMQESSILRKLDHPALVKFYGANFHSFDDPSLLKPTLLMEYLPKGSIKRIFKKEKQSLVENEWTSTKKYIFLLGVADAMRYLHSKGVLHRDLKPENILVDENYYPHVCDFGISHCFPQSISKSMELAMSGKIGVPLYMSPELLEDDECCGAEIDVYAFGVLAYEIVTGQEPYSENGKSISLSKLVKKVLSGEQPKFTEKVTIPMKNLISRCWNRDIKERPSFNDIFNELSSNFSYFKEEIDEKEIKNYLSILEGGKNKEKTVNNKSSDTNIKELQEKYDQLLIKQEEDNKFYLDLIAKQEESQKSYFDLVKQLIEKHGDINATKFSDYVGNILHAVCKLGNIELVKYIISLNRIDLTSTNVFYYIHI